MSKVLTEEQKQRRAEIARANGRKSKGPVSAAGKHRSSMNAITEGKFVEVHEDDPPAFVSVLSAADRKTYIKLYQTNLRNLQPASEHELWLVRSISAEQFQHDRLSKLEVLSFKADRDHAENKNPHLTPDQIDLAAFERLATADRRARFLERKQKLHLAAYDKLTRLLLRMQKDRPRPQKEPIPDTPEQVSEVPEKKPVVAPKSAVAPVVFPFLLTDLTESVTVNQQQKRNSRV